MRLSIFGKRVPLAAVALAACFAAAACEDRMMMEPEPTLYQRLGGQPAIEAVVDQFVANVAADARINGYFANTDIPNLKSQLVDQICEATGGPCTYTGGDMKSVHQGMGVTDADFNALVEDLVAALDQFNVPEKEKGELLSALAAMHDDIVEG